MHYFFSLRKLEDGLFTSSVLKFHNNVLGVGFFFPSVVPGTWWKWTLWSWNMCLLVLGFVCSCVYLFLGFIYLFIYDLCSWWLLPSISGFSLNFLLFRYWIPWITHLEFSHVSFSIFQCLVFCSIFWKISWKFVSHTFVEFIIFVAIFSTSMSFFFFLRWFCFKEHCFCFMGEMSYFSENSNELVLEVLFPCIVLSPWNYSLLSYLGYWLEWSCTIYRWFETGRDFEHVGSQEKIPNNLYQLMQYASDSEM